MTNAHAIGMRADERGHLTSDISRNYLPPAVLERLRRRIALADPHRETAPVTIDEMLTELGRSTARKLLRVPLPLKVAKASIEKVPGVYSLLRIPSSALDYFVLPDATRDVARTGGSGGEWHRLPAVPRLLGPARELHACAPGGGIGGDGVTART